MSGALRVRQRFFRFSLRTALLFFLAVSLALAALRYSTNAWAVATVSLTTVSLLAAAAIGIGSSGQRRTNWIAFSICGAAYLSAVMTFAPEFVLKLPTTIALVVLRENLHPAPEVPFGGFGGAPGGSPITVLDISAGI